MKHRIKFRFIPKCNGWITTTTGDHGRDNTDNYDAIYLGGGRILFTQDGWRTVAMSVGRADVNMPHIVDGNIVFQIESKFGTFADFLIAGYIGGSLIVGGDLYSDGYTTSSDKNSGNYGTHLDLKEGTFEFNSPQSFKQSGKPGKKRLRLYTDTANDGDVLEVNGVIHAKEGNIGSDDNGDGGFIIKHEKFYMAKESFNDGKNGVYIGFDSHVPSTQGISLGIYNGGTKRNPFSVDVTGYLTSTSGYIGGFNIDDKKLYYSTKSSFDSNVQGVYIGFDGSDDSKKGIALGKYNSSTNRSPFSVDINGYLHAEHGEIGGFTITHNSIYKDKDSMDSTADGIYIGNDGIALRSDNRFMVDTVRNQAKIAGFDFTSSSIYKDKNSISSTADGIYIGTDGIALRSDNRFMVDLRNNTAKIAGFDFTSSSLYKDKDSISSTADGIYIGTDGIALRSDNRFMVDVRNNTAKIAGFDFTNNSIYKDKDSINSTADGIYIGNDGIALRSDNRFKVDIRNNTAKIAGFDFTNSYLSTGGKTSIYDDDPNHQGVFVGTSGIALGNRIQDGETVITNPFYVTSSGSLYARYGDIGGIRLRNNGLYSDNDTWYVNSGGYAKFTDVFISGVNKGSSFGDMGYNWDGNTWGKFSADAGSLFGSNIDRPFGGTCIPHIEALAIGKLEVEWLDAGTIKAELLTADHITTGTLDASLVTVTNLDASNITTGTLDASTISVTNLDASNITTGTLDASQVTVTNLDADNITTGEIDGDRVVINNARLHSGVAIQGNIDWNNNSIGTAVISGITVLTYGED